MNTAATPTANPEIVPAERTLFTPPIDIYESEEGLVLIADLPGVSVKSLELQVQNNKLTLLGRVASHLYTDELSSTGESGDSRSEFGVASDGSD